MIGLIINLIYWVLMILLIGRAIFSWIRVDPYDPTWGKVQRFFFQATEPLLQPIRNVIPQTGMIDFSPMILIFGIIIIRQLLLGFF